MEKLDFPHFSRLKLATTYLENFESGLTSMLVLCAPKKTGKTQFIQQDLLPLALEKGYKTVSIDFHTKPDNPAKVILEALQTANITPAINANSKQPVLDTLARTFNSISISNEKTNNHMLIHVDEAQHLATNPSFDSATASLRSFIDKNKLWVKPVFSGSNKTDFLRLFNDRSAPFYQFIELVELPTLDHTYINHALDYYQKATGISLSREKGFAAFQKLKYNPAEFNDLLRILARDKSKTF